MASKRKRKRTKPKPCDCITRVNKHLAAHNTRLDEISLINMETGAARQTLHVATTKVERKPGKAKVMCVTFCPFCGQRTAPEAA